MNGVELNLLFSVGFMQAYCLACLAVLGLAYIWE